MQCKKNLFNTSKENEKSRSTSISPTTVLTGLKDAKVCLDRIHNWKL